MLSRRSMGKLLSAGSVDFFSTLGIFLLASAVARHMGEEAFSIYGLLRRSSGLILGIAAGGASIALTRYVAAHPETQNVRTFLRWAVIQGLIVFALASLVLLMVGGGGRRVLLGDPGWEILLYTLLLSMVLGWCSLLFSTIRGLGRIGWASVFYGSGIVLPLWAGLLFVMRGADLAGLLRLLILGAAVPAFLVSLRAWSRMAKTGTAVGDRAPDRREFYYYSLTRSLPPFLMNLFFAAGLWMAGIHGAAPQQAAFIGAFTVFRIIDAGLHFIGIPLLPWFARRVTGFEQLKAYRKQITGLVMLPIFAGGLAGGLLYTLGTPFIEFFFRVDPIVGTKIIRILALSMPFYSLFVVTRPLLDAVDRRPLALYSIAAGLALSLLVNLGLLWAGRPSSSLAIGVAAGAGLMGLMNLARLAGVITCRRLLLALPPILLISLGLGWGLGTFVVLLLSP